MLVYFKRATQYAWISALNQPSDIRVSFGGNSFLMHILPLGPREGSRGIFLFREKYEPLLTYGSQFVGPGDVALDLGANQGIFCCAFGAAVGAGGRVVAVEPIPHQAERLRTNIQLNGFNQCSVLQKAIADGSGVATLGIGQGDTAASLMAEDKSLSIEVETISIDEIVANFDLKRVDFIKLDVEGAELLALQGAADTLDRFHPTLSLEAGDPVTFEPVRKYVEDKGYQLYVFDADGHLIELKAIKGFVNNVIALARQDLI
jgi:FkbM family methyltransferase